MRIEELYAIYQRYPSVQTDTRKLQKDDLFFALKGPSFNGNSFAAQALEMGAAYAVIDEEAYSIEGKTILVDDVLQTLQQLASHHRDQFNIPFLAITGSNGKTTTKELIHAVLSSQWPTYTTVGNFNNHIGVPLTLLRIKPDARMAVIEMGANHQQEISSYCRIAKPTHGLITNVGKAHLEGFGGPEGVRKGKGELFDWLREHGGTAFIYSGYDYLKEMSEGIDEVLSYGPAPADTEGSVVEVNPFITVSVDKGIEAEIFTQLVGEYNFPNIMAAVALGIYFEVPAENIKQAIENYEPTNSRSQLVERGTNKIILDAYNANPSSMKLAIENFAKTTSGNRILVLGSMAELGTESLHEHEEIVKLIALHPWKEVALVGGEFAKLNHPYRQFPSSADAADWLRYLQPQHSYLLVKGSRSTGMEKVLEGLS